MIKFTFADRLRHHRESLGITKMKASELCKLSYTHYNNYEYGTHEPGSYSLRKICLGLNVSSDYLLDIKSKQNES